MKDLFKKRDADFCSLVDYVKTFIDEKNEDFNLFQLPPIQRNSVWNVAQIERLWDSILRGFPIGSFLISPRGIGKSARDIYSGIQSPSENKGYFLLDGQQRTRSILLGFKPNAGARLWIDLNPNLVFNNTELNDRKFLLRTITTYQPWGMSDRNPQEKLYSYEKYQARIELETENLHYDYQVEIDNGTNDDPSKKYSWPVKANLPVPLDKLIALCGGYSGKFIEPNWADVCKLLPKRYHDLIPVEPTNHYKELLNGLKNLLETKFQEVRTRSIVLLYQSENTTIIKEEEKDPMEVLFVRVNSSGTVLSGEEMAYSLLKSSWDGAYEMVSKIVGSNTIGYLLSSTGVVMAATRLARFIIEENDDPDPGVSNFRRWVSKKSEMNGFLETMKKLLIEDKDEKSPFYKTLETFCALVLFDEQASNDIGLPRKMVLLIKPVLLHPVFIWIHSNIENIELLEKSRINILRYLIYSFITIDNSSIARKVSKAAVSVIEGNRNELFPDIKIYTSMVGELTAPLPTLDVFLNPFKISADGFLRHWGDVFKIKLDDGIIEDDSNAFRWGFWQKKELLLWFQRAYSSKWFIGYNPMSDDNYDTPFDYDHIIPRSHLISQGGVLNIYSQDERGAIFAHDWNRDYYINSIGNYRLWPLWGNRSDNNICHTEKLRMDLTDLSNDNTAKELGLNSSADFLLASAISIDDTARWYNAGGKVKDWPEKRRIAWQDAVERRVCYLYEELYSVFDFKVWSQTPSPE